jgi:hypothetical protein
MMSTAKDPEGHEHVGDEYVTYKRRKERRPRPDFLPFPPNSEEEEETHMEAKRRVERQVEHEAERMLGDIYERLEGSGKAPMEPESNLHASTQQSGSQSACHDSVFGADLIDWL